MKDFYGHLCHPETLLTAWATVRKKGRQGGVDRVSVKQFNRSFQSNINQLIAQLRAEKYLPEPYQELRIRQKAGKTRTLGLPTIKDKIVQQAVRDLIEPVFEKQFLNVSYGYRPCRGAVRAIKRVRHRIVAEKRKWLTMADIDKYFNNVNHDLLFKLIRKQIKDEALLKLIRLWVRMGKVDYRGKWKPRTKGIPQGSIISPLLSNIYLHPFDRHMVNSQYGYVRYADDFIILSHSEEEAYRAFFSTSSSCSTSIPITAFNAQKMDLYILGCILIIKK